MSMLAEVTGDHVRSTVCLPCTLRPCALRVIPLGVGVGVAVGVGVGVGVGAVYWIVNTGGLALSRVSNSFAVKTADTSHNTSQPKLLAGLSSHDCTSATIGAELQTYSPMAPTDWLALTVPEKSPP